MKRFEYTVLDVPAKGFLWGGRVEFAALDAKLNELGREGWEVASSGDTNMRRGASRSVFIILKREVLK